MSESQEDNKPKGFDLIVTHRDPKTGQVIKSTPYILRVCGEQGSDQKARYWERPKGSGNLFDKHNNPVGRWIYEDKIVKGKKVKVGKYDEKAEHIKWVPPLTEDQKIAQKNAALEAEVASLRAEKEKLEAKLTPKKG